MSVAKQGDAARRISTGRDRERTGVSALHDDDHRVEDSTATP